MTNIRVKVAVIYYSATGRVADIALEIAEAVEGAGAAVRLRKVAELAPKEVVDANPVWAATAAVTADIPVATADDIVWADAVIMGTPTRFGNVSAELKQYVDRLGGAWEEGLLANKVYSGFTATGTLHGGHESTLLALYQSFHHFGGIVVAPGYTHPSKLVDGNPYGTSHHDAAGRAGVDETTRVAARVQAERVVEVARATATMRSTDLEAWPEKARRDRSDFAVEAAELV